MFHPSSLARRAIILPITLYALTCHAELIDETKSSAHITSSYETVSGKVLGLKFVRTISNIDGVRGSKVFFRKSFMDKSHYPYIRLKSSIAPDVRYDQGITKYVSAGIDYVQGVTGPYKLGLVSLQIVPCDVAYTSTHNSLSIRPLSGPSILFTFNDKGGFSCDGDDRKTSHAVTRTVSHEIFHVIVSDWGMSRSDNEKAAVTIENCAELSVFGVARRDAHIPMSAFDKLSLTVPQKALIDAKFGPDPPLDEIFSQGDVIAGSDAAKKLFDLCEIRANRHPRY